MAAVDNVRIADLAKYLLSTQNRPLRLRLDRNGSNTDCPLLPQKFTGHEAICAGFEHHILCVAESAALALKEFIGVPAELQIVTDRGQLRRVCGIVTAAMAGHSDGGLATYKLIMRDALSVMESRVNTRIFRNMSELDIIETLVAEWRAHNPILAGTLALHIDGGLLNGKLAQREFTMQHNESDAAFLRRLMQRRGIAWFFRPGLGDRSDASRRQTTDAIGHTLVLFDDPHSLHESAAGLVRFHREAATEERDTVTYWSAERTLQPGKAWLHSWDYKNIAGTPLMDAQTQSQANQGECGNALAASLEDYYVAAPHLGDTSPDLAALGATQMAHFEFLSKLFHGEANVRDLAAGEWFTLAGHPEIDTHPARERQFVITEQWIAAQNNMPIDISVRVDRLFNRNGWDDGDTASAAGRWEQPRYKTRFSCGRRSVRIVPPRPVMQRPGMQTAIVVGPVDEQVWCDEMGRVKVRFPAARQQDHVHAAGAGASDSDIDSGWVRTSSHYAGNGPGPGSGAQCGARFLPTVGTEVLIDWAGGDPDKPVIVGQLFNGTALPPAFRGEGGLPATRYQSGLRTREIQGQRGNQLRFDDTPMQISAQLESDHATSELTLGYLTEPRQNGAAAPRGEGAELRTDAAIALHAARGIFLSAWTLFGDATKGRQLARTDFVALLQQCGELAAAVGSYASEHNGLAADGNEQADLLARFRNWENGSNTAPNATAPAEPVIGITSPAGIGFASSKAIVSYSAKNIDTVAQQHLQFTAGQRVTVNAGNGMSLFAQHGGLSAIAHFGKLVLQSQHDDTTIDSAKNMQLTASDGQLTLSATALHLITEDGSFIRMGNGAFVIGSKYPIQFQAPDFIYDGPETMKPLRATFTSSGADQKFELRYPSPANTEAGAPSAGGIVKGVAINVALSDGSTTTARSDAQGKSELLARDAMHIADIDVLRGGSDQ